MDSTTILLEIRKGLIAEITERTRKFREFVSENLPNTFKDDKIVNISKYLANKPFNDYTSDVIDLTNEILRITMNDDLIDIKEYVNGRPNLVKLYDGPKYFMIQYEVIDGCHDDGDWKIADGGYIVCKLTNLEIPSDDEIKETINRWSKSKLLNIFHEMS